MASKQQRMSERMVLRNGEHEVSSSMYNLVIGLVLTYGFLMNVIMIKCFHNPIMNAFVNTDSMAPIIIAIVGYVVCCLIGTLLVHHSNNPVVSFIGFNFFALPIGLLLSICIPMYPSSVVIRAFALTAIITGVMMIVASIIPTVFISMGKTLLISLIICLIIDVIAMFMGADLVIVDYAMTFIFTLFVGYDWSKANLCAKTLDNAVDCAAELYLDIINLFLRILSILSRAND